MNYRENAKPKLTLFYVTICYRNENYNEHATGWVLANDSFKALEKFTDDNNVKISNIWAQSVVSKEDFLEQETHMMAKYNSNCEEKYDSN